MVCPRAEGLHPRYQGWRQFEIVDSMKTTIGCDKSIKSRNDSRQISNISATKSQKIMFPVSFCSCLCTIHWSQMLDREWRYSAAPTQKPLTWSFHVFFYLRLNKPWSKQSWGWWFETLWCHCNAMATSRSRGRKCLCVLRTKLGKILLDLRRYLLEKIIMLGGCS